MESKGLSRDVATNFNKFDIKKVQDVTRITEKEIQEFRLHETEENLFWFAKRDILDKLTRYTESEEFTFEWDSVLTMPYFTIYGSKYLRTPKFIVDLNAFLAPRNRKAVPVYDDNSKIWIVPLK